MNASEYFELLSKLKYEQLVAIKGVGPILAQNIIDYIESEKFKVIHTKLQRLEAKDKGITIQMPKQKVDGVLSSEIICITGTFSIPRPQIKALLEEQGAKVVDSVTSTTTILIAGEKAGSKLTKAEKIGIKIVNDYREILN